jgi:hypothetical protein
MGQLTVGSNRRQQHVGLGGFNLHPVNSSTFFPDAARSHKFERWQMAPQSLMRYSHRDLYRANVS